jgi:hypothetical protein
MNRMLFSISLFALVSMAALGATAERPTWPVNDDVSKAYVSAESVLDLEDREAGRLVGKGVISLPGMGSYIVRHVLTVEVKDERYRYTLDKVTWSAGQGTAKTPPRPMTDKGNMMGKLTAKKDIRAWDELNTLIDSLKAAMQAANDDDEW